MIVSWKVAPDVEGDGDVNTEGDDKESDSWFSPAVELVESEVRALIMESKIALS